MPETNTRSPAPEPAATPPGRSCDPSEDATLTIPNGLSVLRIIGTLVLLALAWAGRAGIFPWLLVVVIATDWIDGQLAVLLRQRSRLGARLDSIADTFLYASLVLCAWWLRPEFIRLEFWLLFAVGVSYLLSVVTCLVRFRRVPSYHAWSAKLANVLVAVGAVVMFAGGPCWPLRIALVLTILANLEEIAISLVLPRERSNVPSLPHALRRSRALRRELSASSGGASRPDRSRDSDR